VVVLVLLVVLFLDLMAAQVVLVHLLQYQVVQLLVQENYRAVFIILLAVVVVELMTLALVAQVV